MGQSDRKLLGHEMGKIDDNDDAKSGVPDDVS
jgi:hypothetical protein